MPKQPTISPELLAAALEGLQAQRKQIDAQIAEVRQMLGSPAPAVGDGSATTPGGKRTMSAAAKKRIAEAQRKRWQVFHQQQGSAPRNQGKAAAGKAAASAAQPRKRKLSAEGRRRIIEATKKRWAAVRAAQKKAGAGK